MGATVTQLLDSLGVDASHLVLVAMAMAFIFVSLATYMIGRVLHGRERIRQRALSGAGKEDDVFNDRRSLRNQRLAGTTKLLSRVGANFVPGDKASVSAVRKNLMAAGFYQPGAIVFYYLSRVSLAALAPAVTFLVVKFGNYDLAGTRFLSLLAGAGIAGLMLPSFVVSRRAKKMQRQSRQGFPDFMDLMVVCAEAGISLEAAIERVSREIAQNYPFLGVSLHMASLELRAGKPLIEAFRNLADRLGIEEAHNLGSLLQQSEELGTSLSGALRVFSDEMRDKRMSVAEEKAHALPAKMAVPLTMFVFPTILIVILLPVFVRVSTM